MTESYKSPLNDSRWKMIRKSIFLDDPQYSSLTRILWALTAVLIILNVYYAITSGYLILVGVSVILVAALVGFVRKQYMQYKQRLYMSAVLEVVGYVKQYSRRKVLPSLDVLLTHENPATRKFLSDFCVLYVNSLIGKEKEETLLLAEEFLTNEVQYLIANGKGSNKHYFEALLEVQKNR